MFIMLCVVFISMGGGEAPADEEEIAEVTRRMLAGPSGKKREPNAPKLSQEEANMYLYFGIIAALIAGFILSINTVSL